MNTGIKEIYIVDGPMYEETGEDGLYYYFDYFIVVLDENDIIRTHKREWRHNETYERDLFMDKVKKSGYINTEHWWEGDVWDAYKIPQTYEEEKRDALEWEASH